MKLIKNLVLIASTTVLLFSCSKVDDVTPKVYSIPTTYNFEGAQANYTLATNQLSMLSQLIGLAETGNIVNTEVSKTALLNMYNNTNSPFTGNLSTFTGSSLFEATAIDFRDDMANWIDTLAQSSKSTTFGSNGVAGVVYRNNSSTGKLYNKKGFAAYEIMEKGMMGAFQLYQITQVYLSNSKIGASVSKTEKQKNWDMAFGYLGVPTNFPNNTESTPFWGEYFNTNSATLNNNTQIIMTAFLTGRAAIDNDDQSVVEQSAETIITELEKTAVGMTLTYLNRSKTAITNEDNGRRNGSLSETLGFAITLKYIANSKISASEVQEIIDLIGTNNWVPNVDNLDTALTKLSGIYGLDATRF